MKALRFSSFPLGLTLFAVGCPSDDGSGTGTDTATDPTTPTSTSGPMTESATTPTATTPTSSDPTTDTTTDATGTASSGESESGSGSSSGGLECPYRPVDGEPGVTLEMVADGFDGALLVVGDPIENDVLYVLQKNGEIKRLGAGETSAPAENWLDLDVATSSEQGVLGLAFSPDYENNSLIYVAHTPNSLGGDIAVTEFTVEGGVPNPGSARNVIGFGDEQPNHNGGMVQFGPDDMLYISIGDGGTQNDGCGHGQDTEVFMGKILRIDPTADGALDVDPGCGPICGCGPASGEFDYTVPGDNPFVGMAGFRPELYAYGFRNPWRMSFDPIDGRLWVGDVGQDAWEEVSVIEAGDNAGWGSMEGAHCNNDGGCDEGPGLNGGLNADGMRMPVAEYQNSGPRCSMIGLGNYRSCEVEAWDGVYFYADACSAEVFAVAFDGSEVTDLGVVTSAPASVWGGGYNAYGDVYVATASDGGSAPIYRIAPAK